MVRDECLEFALQNGEKFGIWGGLSERERRRIRRQRAQAARSVARRLTVRARHRRPRGDRASGGCSVTTMIGFDIGGPEAIIIFVIVLVLFGGSQIPKLARNLGRAQKEFKDGIEEAQRRPRRPSVTDTHRHHRPTARRT